MKKSYLLSIFLSCILLYSCTSDDDTTDPIITPEKHLLKMNQRIYNSGQLEEKITFIYENNKPKIDSFYTSSNQLTFYTKHLYNSNGFISSIKGYNPNGSLENESIYSYDNLNRINKLEKIEGTYSSTSNYTFNNDNTITSVSTSNGNIINTKTYFLNGNEIIFKEQSSNNTVELTYDSNLNLTQKTSYNTTYNFEYNEPHLVPSLFLFDNSTFVGPKKMNKVLFSNSLDDNSGSFGNKFISKTTSSNGGIVNQVFTYDLDNYPINIKIYRNNELVSEIVYTYSN